MVLDFFFWVFVFSFAWRRFVVSPEGTKDGRVGRVERSERSEATIRF